MSKFVVDELETTLYQDFSFKLNKSVKAIRPNLYLHNSPSGTFTVSLKEGATTLASKSYTMAQIESLAGFTANQYHHGYFTFEFDDYINLKNNKTYRIELSAAAYTFSESAYIGWIRPHENLYNNATSEINAYDNAFGFQLWSINA